MSWRVFCFIAISVSLFAAVFYIWQVNRLTSGVYFIKTYQKQLDKVSEENSELEIGFAESSFLQGVEAKAKQMSFEKTTAVKYLQVMEGSMAVNK